MSRINKDIKEQFDFFNELLSGVKTISDTEIILSPKKSNAFWVEGTSKAEHATIKEDIQFGVSKSKRDLKYGVSLRCKSMTKEPFFRFDSDGPAHRNDDPQIPLEEQSITTPHFNSFNDKGQSIAYKNDTLKKEAEAKAISADINLGISLFAMETKSQLKDGNFPVAKEQAPELEFKEGIATSFDNIPFED